MSRRDLRHVLDAILAGVVVIDAEGRVQDLNAAACRILGLSAEFASGALVESLLGPEHAVAQLGRRCLVSGSSASEGDQAIEARRTEPLFVDVASSPLFDEAGAVDGAVLVLRDRTVQRRLQRLEAERERFASLGRIAAGLAHEVKNPLGGIRGAAELLARRDTDAKTRETAELIVRESTRIATLVDDFMIFARGDRLQCGSLNLHQVLDGVLDLLAMDPVSSRAEVVRLFDPSIPDFVGDSDRLTQIFLNLARNALQAMQPEGGTLTISTAMDLGHRLATDAGPRLPTVAVSFRDTGSGMDAELREQVTTPFFTTRPGGTGLGLAVAEYWTARHGGSLQIESEPGVGTTVQVALPLRRAFVNPGLSTPSIPEAVK